MNKASIQIVYFLSVSHHRGHINRLNLRLSQKKLLLSYIFKEHHVVYRFNQNKPAGA